jgi:ABC-type branched-subunit amino acid transport system ATPase component
MRLQLRGVSVRFGSIAALGGVDLDAAPGERLGIMGPNGAGKTTLLDVIGGLQPPTSGEVRLGNRRLTGLPPERVARLGVGRTFQSPRLFTRLTVEANVRAGRGLSPASWLDLVGLLPRRGDLAGALTPGEARRLELARALAGQPRVLLVDEPCAGLHPGETDAMAALLARAVAPGQTLILVEHKLGVIGRLCDRVAVLHLGEKIFDGAPGAMQHDGRVLEAYLGMRRPP